MIRSGEEGLLRGGLRATDLPYSRGWGFFIRFLKSFEVLIFKLLQTLDLYRAQKSVVAIPSLATRNCTSLQAIVYNGTQEEVLGFRPRRLIHRVLRGLPDLELFERLQFQLTVSEGRMRSAVASTETRGFIHLQLPWQLPWRSPNRAYLRISPLGVETLFGRMQLGDYEVLSCPVFFLNDDIKWVIVSDIDDTIKDSRVAQTTGLKQVVSGLFRGHYYGYTAISGMADLYSELAEQGVLIIYLTSTPYPLIPFLLKFLRQSGFPEGPVYPRWLGYGRFGHKWRTLHRILSNIERQKLILIGDSGEQDLQIYRRVAETEPFSDRIERILIRHIPGTPRQRTAHDRESIYGNVSELKEILLQTIAP